MTLFPLVEGPVNVPCIKCGAMALRIEFRLRAKPPGSYSLSGSQPKVSTYRWPYMVCDGCESECAATVAYGNEGGADAEP